MKKKKVRQANMELLRMVAMVGITLLHILYWSDAILLEDNAVTGLRMAGSVLESLCVPMVAVYVMISGYYDTCEEFRTGRIVRLLLEVWFYSAGIHAALLLGGRIPRGESIWELARYLFPVSMKHYWFVTAFVGMELLAPLLAAAVERVTKDTLKKILIGLLLYESIPKTILPFQLTADQQGYDFGFFVLVFLLAAWLRKYGAPTWLQTTGRRAALYLGSCAVIALVQIGAAILHSRTGSFSYLMNAPFHYNYLFALSASVGLFLWFQKLSVPEGRCADRIRKAAPLSFGVYLIQCHADLLPGWPQYLAGLTGVSAESTPAAVFFLFAVGSALLVYILCSAVDALRRILFEGAEKLCRKK